MKKRGFTLMEILMTVVVLGILASLSYMPLTRTLERARWRAARDILEAIYAGERVYFTMNSDLYCDVPAVCTWNQIYVDDPNTSDVIGGVVFNVAITGGGTGFQATATRAAGPCPWDTGIDEARTSIGSNLTADSVC